MDAAKASTFNRELAAMVAELGKKHGMVVKSGKLTYSDDGFRVQVTGVEVSETELADPRLKSVKPADMARAKQLGYFGKTVKYGTSTVEIVGYNGFVLLGYMADRGGVRFNQKQTEVVMPQLAA